MIKKFLKSPLIFILLVVLAIAFVVFQVKNKPVAARSESTGLPAVAVEYLTLGVSSFHATATGYGYVEPAITLDMKSEVSGKVSYIHPELKKGGTVEKGALVLKIEPTTFELDLDQSQASLQASRSSLDQLKVERQSTQKLLEIARKNLQVGEAEFNRVQKIYERNLVAKSVVDEEEQKVLSLRQQVEDYEGNLASFDSRESSTQADIEKSASVVSQSQDTLGRTEVYMPFNARIGTVSVEEGEYVTVGGLLFEALGMAAAEITAELPTSQFRPLIIGHTGNSPDELRPGSMNDAVSRLHLDASVSLVGDTGTGVKWPGALLRISESVDPTRDTIGLVVSVADPYKGIVPGKKPPLVKGMYTSVTFTAPEYDALVIPRNALHQGRVYIADESDKLAIKPVTVSFAQGEIVVLDNELSSVGPGDRIITSDVIPVIPGMQLRLMEQSQ